MSRLDSVINFTFKHWYLISFCLGFLISSILMPWLLSSLHITVKELVTVAGPIPGVRYQASHSIIPLSGYILWGFDNATPIWMVAVAAGLFSLVCGAMIRALAFLKVSGRLQFGLLLVTSLILAPWFVHLQMQSLLDIN
jgi:hypothetical protein